MMKEWLFESDRILDQIYMICTLLLFPFPKGHIH